jgi:hypothetical protein
MMLDAIFSFNVMADEKTATKPTNNTKPNEKGEPIPPPPVAYIGSHFSLPIHYVAENQKHKLSPVIAKDLEMISENNDPTMYDYVFDASGHAFAKEVQPKYVECFSSNVDFLTQSQTIVENTPRFFPASPCSVSCETIRQHWTNVKHDKDFLEKYGYLEWSMLAEYNRSSVVLQSICLANMLAPLSSFLVPILFFLFPFIILKIQNVPITFDMYITVLKSIAQHHFIGKAISGLQSMAFDKILYVVGMLFLYLFQMYQNVIHCIRFYNHVERINRELGDWKEFVQYSIANMKAYLRENDQHSTYQPFCDQIRRRLETLEEIQELLDPVCPFECSIFKVTEIGYMLRCYYELHVDAEYETSLCYAMGFDGYVHLLHGVHDNMEAHCLHKAQFKKEQDVETEVDKDENEENDDNQDQEETEDDNDESQDQDREEPNEFITNQYYPPLKHDPNVVKNNASLDANMVITGPNASGKTTYLKTTAMNIILAQQLGVGFFDSCCIVPYVHMHSYLNIPDTSGRDSLFQAESRRCKEILDAIETHHNERHFCIFDELYSGTNPEEATKAAYAFMKYVSNKPNAFLLLTTHYVSICDKWKRDETIANYQMEVLCEDEQYEYTYLIKPGVSKVHGAAHILEQMDYPQSILDEIKS